MTDNMKQVTDVMDIMTENVQHSEETTKTMLSKYQETLNNVVHIEKVVGTLMEELGAGGFMGLKDVKTGMRLSLYSSDTENSKEIRAEIAEVMSDGVLIELPEGRQQFKLTEGTPYTLHIVVDNVLYIWDDIQVIHVQREGRAYGKLNISKNPKVLNRRKYSRMPINNPCQIMLGTNSHSYIGKMVTISANGFAFITTAEEFADCKGQQVTVTLSGFKLLENTSLEGCIIRSTDEDGNYTVGCRMPEDNEAIKNYVKEHN